MALPTPTGKIGTPVTSQTGGPGFTPNINSGVSPNPNSSAVLGQTNHSQWADALIQYLVAKWVHGDKTLPNSWSVTGPQPDASDVGGGSASAQTWLAFSNFVNSYKGGDPSIEAISPYVPPGPGDFIQDPTVTAADLANQQWNKVYDESVREFGITADATAKKDAQVAFNDAFQNELKVYSEQVGLWTTQTDNQLKAYNIQADLYKSNQSDISANLQHAGTLAEQLQAIEDKRTQDAIDLKADPRNYIAENYDVRAQQAPQGTSSPAFQNVDALTEVIRRLIDYQPQTPPTAPATPVGPVPTAPNQQTFRVPPGAGQGSLQSAVNPPPIAKAVPPPTNIYNQPAPYTAPQAPPITGAGSAPSTPTTGAQQTAWPGSTTRNGVLYDAEGHYSTDQGNSWFNNDGSPYQASGSPNTSSGSGSTPALARGTNQLGTVARQFIAGDTQRPGVPNPELVKVRNPGPDTRVVVIPLSDAIKGYARGTKNSPKTLWQIVKGYAYGTPAYADGTDPNNPMLTSYSDQDIQNQPYLQYMQGNNQDTFRNIASGYATGSNGQRVPEAGSFNVWNYSQLSPLEQGMLASDYKSANRDLASTLALAKARAPYGTAVNTSIIKT